MMLCKNNVVNRNDTISAMNSFDNLLSADIFCTMTDDDKLFNGIMCSYC